MNSKELNNEFSNVWYACMTDLQDDDWSFGFWSFSDAVEWCVRHPGSYIALIDETGSQPICIDEIHLR